MAKKLKLKEIEMDTMEILYYERQTARKKAYEAKRRKRCEIKNKKPSDRILKQAI